MSYHVDQVRVLTSSDAYAIERLMRTSEYIYQRFTLAELPLLLKRYPTVGLFHEAVLHGFLLSQITNASCAWIGGFGVSWTESKAYFSVFMTLLDQLALRLVARGVRYLHYSGNDPEGDWLRTLLLKRGFIPYRQLYAYDKFDFRIPTTGNQQVTIRPVHLAADDERSNRDMAALLALEDVCFEELWRYDRVAFFDIAATHPYFVVAELNGRIVGYQFNTLEGDAGYLIRIAVHPDASGHGIGARLMAEAIRFFRHARVSRIMLNTQEDNHHAHRLYEWFGFVRLQSEGFVMRKTL